MKGNIIMQQDSSYLPLKTDFDHVMSTYFPNVAAPDEIKTFQMIFFAGAAASYQLLTVTPEKTDTVLAELIDHTEQLEASA